LQPKGWIKKRTITKEHKVNTIQYNKNITHSLNMSCYKTTVKTAMINSVVNKRCLKTCCAHKARSSTVVDKPRDAWL